MLLVHHTLPIQDHTYCHTHTVWQAGEEVQASTLAAGDPSDHILSGDLADIPTEMEAGSD